MPCDAYTRPVTATPGRGIVLIAAPEGAAVFALTAVAALESAYRIIDAAELALAGSLLPIPRHR